jgi:hypothetical protein
MTPFLYAYITIAYLLFDQSARTRQGVVMSDHANRFALKMQSLKFGLQHAGTFTDTYQEYLWYTLFFTGKTLDSEIGAQNVCSHK